MSVHVDDPSLGFKIHTDHYTVENDRKQKDEDRQRQHNDATAGVLLSFLPILYVIIKYIYINKSFHKILNDEYFHFFFFSFFFSSSFLLSIIILVHITTVNR